MLVDYDSIYLSWAGMCDGLCRPLSLDAGGLADGGDGGGGTPRQPAATAGT